MQIIAWYKHTLYIILNATLVGPHGGSDPYLVKTSCANTGAIHDIKGVLTWQATTITYVVFLLKNKIKHRLIVVSLLSENEYYVIMF